MYHHETNEKNMDDKKGSPTSVSEFHAKFYPHGDHCASRKKLADIELPDITLTPPHSRKQKQSQHRKQVLVTTNPDNHDLQSYQHDTEDVSYRKLEVERLLDVASKLSLRGNEEKALELYSNALNMAKYILTKLSLVFRSSRYAMVTTIADIFMRMVTEYERKENYKMAIKMCIEAHDFHCHNGSNESFVRLQQNLEDISSTITRLEKAAESCKTRNRLKKHAEQIYDKAKTVHDPSTRAHMLDRVSITLDRLLTLERTLCGESHPCTATTLERLATLNFEMNNNDIARGQLDSAARALVESLGPLHPKVGMTYQLLGAAYLTESRSDLVKATDYYKKAIVSFRESLGVGHVLVGRTLNNLAAVYIEQEKFDMALETLNDALVVYERYDSNDKTHLDTAYIWKNLGNVYYRQKLWEIAIISYTAALDIRMTHQDAPIWPISRETVQSEMIEEEDLADTLEKLGQATAAVERNEDAKEIFRCVLRIRQAVVDSSDSASRDVNAEASMAFTVLCLAKVCESIEQLEEALSYYYRFLQLSRTAGSEFGNAVALTGVGSVRIKQGEFDKAIDALKEALDVFEGKGLPKEHDVFKYAKMKFVEAKMCKKSSLRQSSTVSALKKQLDSKSQQLRRTEDENHRMKYALMKQLEQSEINVPASAIECNFKDKEFLRRYSPTTSLLHNKLNGIATQISQRRELNQKTQCDVSENTSLADYLSKPRIDSLLVSKGDETCDSKELCLQKVDSAGGGFVQNMDFEKLFQRELTEEDTITHTVATAHGSESLSVSSEDQQSLSPFLRYASNGDLPLQTTRDFFI